MKILITGAQGQVGRSLVQSLAAHQVKALSHAELDITKSAEIEKILNQEKPEAVFNTAAYTNVDGAETDSAGAYKGNEDGPRLLATATAKRGAALFHFSTDYVFDGTATKPYLEDAKPNPSSVYAKSKLAGEVAVQKNNPRHYIIRTAWVYHTVGKNFPNTILSLAKKPELRVVNDQFGSPTYAPHLAASVSKMLERPYSPGIYHLAGSGWTSWYDLTRALFSRLEIKTPVVAVPTSEFPRPARRPAYAVLGSRKAPELALPPWERGLDEFVKSLRNNERGRT